MGLVNLDGRNTNRSIAFQVISAPGWRLARRLIARVALARVRCAGGRPAKQKRRPMKDKTATLDRVPAHRLEGALRFSVHDVRVGQKLRIFHCSISAENSPAL